MNNKRQRNKRTTSNQPGKQQNAPIKIWREIARNIGSKNKSSNQIDWLIDWLILTATWFVKGYFIGWLGFFMTYQLCPGHLTPN